MRQLKNTTWQYKIECLQIRIIMFVAGLAKINNYQPLQLTAVYNYYIL